MQKKHDLRAKFRKILHISKRISQRQVATMLECSEQELSLLLLEWAESEAFIIDGPDILRAEIETKSKTDAFVQKSGEQYLKRNTISSKSRPKKIIFRIAIVGNESVGKTSLIQSFIERKFSENYILTIGSNFFAHLIRKPEENIVVRLQLWDLAGQQHFKFVRPSFYQGKVSCVYVFDLTSRESFDSIGEWEREFVTYNPDVPSMLIGNNVDLTEERVVSRVEGEALAQEMDVPYYETSVSDPTHTANCFYELNERLMDKFVRKNLQ